MIADSRPEARPEPGRNKALALTLLMHALLVAVLFLGVQWKRSAPDVVEVELWAPRPSQPAPPPEPTPPPPEPPKPEPPKPVPPEPVKPPPPKPVEVKKPDIVEKAPEKKPEKKPPEKPPEPLKPPPPKPVPEVKPTPKPTPSWQSDLDQELNKTRAETARMTAAANAESELRAAANKRGLASWGDKIRSKVRSNVTLPPSIQGNPEAIFELNLLPTGEVMQPVKLKKSSGNTNLDAAIERAILKSSPLPKPDDPNVFQRVIEIKYRPFEE